VLADGDDRDPICEAALAARRPRAARESARTQGATAAIDVPPAQPHGSRRRIAAASARCRIVRAAVALLDRTADARMLGRRGLRRRASNVPGGRRTRSRRFSLPERRRAEPAGTLDDLRDARAPSWRESGPGRASPAAPLLRPPDPGAEVFFRRSLRLGASRPFASTVRFGAVVTMQVPPRSRSHAEVTPYGEAKPTSKRLREFPEAVARAARPTFLLRSRRRADGPDASPSPFRARGAGRPSDVIRAHDAAIAREHVRVPQTLVVSGTLRTRTDRHVYELAKPEIANGATTSGARAAGGSSPRRPGVRSSPTATCASCGAF